MKKLLILSILLLTPFIIFADAISTAIGTDATADAILDFSETSDENSKYVNFGFTGSDVTAITPKIERGKSEVKLSLDTSVNGKVTASNAVPGGTEDALYVFCQAVTGTPFSLTLKINEPMKAESAGTGTPTLNWSVTVDKDDPESDVTISSDTSDGNTGSTLLVDHKATDPIQVLFSHKLTIKTGDVSALTQGIYKGTLVLTTQSDS